MEKLVLDGKEFVKATKAATLSGYTRDYIGQLARADKIEAHLVGRSWYVNVDQLSNYKVESKRNSRVKAREQVRKAVTEVKAKDKQSGRMHFETRHIDYEEDTSDLIPQTKKISVVSESTVSKSKDAKTKTAPKAKKEENYTIENEGDKVVMSGTLSVVDATDEDLLDENTVILEPRINKKKKKLTPAVQSRSTEVLIAEPQEFSEEITIGEGEQTSEETEETEETNATEYLETKAPDFLTRLKLMDEAELDVSDEEEVFTEEESPTAEATTTSYWYIHVSLILVAMILSLSLFVVNQKDSYSVTSERSTQYLVNLTPVMSFLGF